MKVRVNGHEIDTQNEPCWTGTSIGYQMLTLTQSEAKSLGHRGRKYAIRIDGMRASLVRRVGDYTSEVSARVELLPC